MTQDTPTVRLIDRDQALGIVRRLVQAAEEVGESLGSPIVLVDDTALVAHGLRAHCLDVCLFAPEVADESVRSAEQEVAARIGPSFKLDVTPGENLWGSILVRDIEESPDVERIRTPRGEYVVRALRVEDLFLLKIAADRDKDRADLPALAAVTDTGSLIRRFNQLQAWHGDRSAVMGFADALVAALVRLHGADPATIIDQLAVTPTTREALRDAWDIEG